MNQESGGNPRAINNWDSNARRGTPSKGLMQVIGPTFRANAHPKYNKDIWDPLSNILASMRYALKRYGSLPAAYNKKGGYSGGGLVKAMKMDNGGWLPRGDSMIRNATSSPERIRTMDEEMFLQRSMAMSNREYQEQRNNGVNIAIEVNGSTDPLETANAVADKLNFAMRKHRIGSF
ncbi:transglycosylase SLT domain-containing protein [Brevibacterium casei]|uniref:lytic transglycosylase domain-containing protein n=1 Tax=Brevibacterium casei TaxID=33889 RepID=UPI003F7F2476